MIGYDLLLAEREDKDASLGRRLISRISRGIVHTLYGHGVNDINSPFRLMRAARLRRGPAEVPVTRHLRPTSSSRHGLFEKKQDIYDGDEATRRREAPPQQVERLIPAGSYSVRHPDLVVPDTMVNRTYITLLILLAACVLLPCCIVLLSISRAMTKRYSGMAVGSCPRRRPYRDFFDHKPPLIYFLNFAGLCLGTWGLWLIDLTLVLLATGRFFSNAVSGISLPFPWLLPLALQPDAAGFPDHGRDRHDPGIY